MVGSGFPFLKVKFVNLFDIRRSYFPHGCRAHYRLPEAPDHAGGA
jgi:hypothetical protein